MEIKYWVNGSGREFQLKWLDIPGNQHSFLDRGGVEVTEDEIQQVTVFQHSESAENDVGQIQGSHDRQFLSADLKMELELSDLKYLKLKAKSLYTQRNYRI